MKHQIHFLTNLGGMLRSMASAMMFVAVFMLSLPHTAVADDWVPTTSNGKVTYTGETITVAVDNLETNGHWSFFVIQLDNTEWGNGARDIFKLENKNGGYYVNGKYEDTFITIDSGGYEVDDIGHIDWKSGYVVYDIKKWLLLSHSSDNIKTVIYL